MLIDFYCPAKFLTSNDVEQAYVSDITDFADLPAIRNAADHLGCFNREIEVGRKNKAGIRDEFYEGEPIRDSIRRITPEFVSPNESAVWLRVTCEMVCPLTPAEMDALKEYAAKQIDSWSMHGIQALDGKSDVIYAFTNASDYFDGTPAREQYAENNLLTGDEWRSLHNRGHKQEKPSILARLQEGKNAAAQAVKLIKSAPKRDNGIEV